MITLVTPPAWLNVKYLHEIERLISKKGPQEPEPDITRLYRFVFIYERSVTMRSGRIPDHPRASGYTVHFWSRTLSTERQTPQTCKFSQNALGREI
jgi:hypothetical protein